MSKTLQKALQVVAEVEFARLKNAAAWSPLATVRTKNKNKFGARYIFEDDSRLNIYFDGSASCERHASDVISFERQWHSCTYITSSAKE